MLNTSCKKLYVHFSQMSISVPTDFFTPTFLLCKVFKKNSWSEHQGFTNYLGVPNTTPNAISQQCWSLCSLSFPWEHQPVGRSRELLSTMRARYRKLQRQAPDLTNYKKFLLGLSTPKEIYHLVQWQFSLNASNSSTPVFLRSRGNLLSPIGQVKVAYTPCPNINQQEKKNTDHSLLWFKINPHENMKTKNEN